MRTIAPIYASNETQGRKSFSFLLVKSNGIVNVLL